MHEGAFSQCFTDIVRLSQRSKQVGPCPAVSDRAWPRYLVSLEAALRVGSAAEVAGYLRSQISRCMVLAFLRLIFCGSLSARRSYHSQWAARIAMRVRISSVRCKNRRTIDAALAASARRSYGFDRGVDVQAVASHYLRCARSCPRVLRSGGVL